MTKTKAIAILQRHGFDLTSSQTFVPYRADILHPLTGNHLHGRIYEDSMCINNDLEDNSKYLWFNFVHGSSASTDFEKTVEKLEHEIKNYEEIMRNKRVENVKQYFKAQDLKRLRRDELLSSVKRGEHLSREEQRELSAMCYTI